MSQMYHVAYASRGREAGKAIVCASSADQAGDLVLLVLGLPPSGTVFEVSRVKPGFYQIERRDLTQVDHPQTAPVWTEQGGNDRPTMFDLVVTGQVRSYTEAAAWRKLSEFIKERASSNVPPDAKSAVRDIVMSCDSKIYRPRESSVERQGIYTHPRFFAGGAGRPR